MFEDGRVKVYIEKLDEKDCFHHATCYLPKYEWEDIFGVIFVRMLFAIEYVDVYMLL